MADTTDTRAHHATHATMRGEVGERCCPTARPSALLPLHAYRRDRLIERVRFLCNGCARETSTAARRLREPLRIITHLCVVATCLPDQSSASRCPERPALCRERLRPAIARPHSCASNAGGIGSEQTLHPACTHAASLGQPLASGAPPSKRRSWPTMSDTMRDARRDARREGIQATVPPAPSLGPTYLARHATADDTADATDEASGRGRPQPTSVICT